LVVWAKGGARGESFASFKIMAYALPGLVAFGFRWIVEHKGFKKSFGLLGLRWPRPLSWLGVIGLPLALLIPGFLLPLLFGMARFDPTLSVFAEQLREAGLDPGQLHWYFWSKLGMSMSVGLLLLLPVGLLNEMGSRSYLITLFSERFKPKLVMVLTGAFWALVFLPFFTLDNPYGTWWGLLLYLAFAWSWAVLLAWLYNKAKSVLIPALAFLILDILNEAGSYWFVGSWVWTGAMGVFAVAVSTGLAVWAVITTKQVWVLE